MKNKITDLRNHLFAQLERLGDEDMNDEKLQLEVKRSKAICDVAAVMVESAKVEVQLMTEIAWEGTGFIDNTKQQKELPIQASAGNLALNAEGKVVNSQQEGDGHE